MGLFSSLWSKNEPAQEAEAMDFRREPRSRVATAWPAVEVKIGSVRAQALDVSDSGFCVALEESRAPDHAMAVITKGDEVIRKAYALRVWRSGTRVGYSFAEGLGYDPVLERRAAQATAKKRALDEASATGDRRPSVRERLKL